VRYERIPSAVVVKRLQRRVGLERADRYWKAFVDRLTERRECSLAVARACRALRRGEERSRAPSIHAEYAAPQARCFGVVAAAVGAVCLSRQLEDELRAHKTRGNQESGEKAAPPPMENSQGACNSRDEPNFKPCEVTQCRIKSGLCDQSLAGDK
jgi:hypothetical protein